MRIDERNIKKQNHMRVQVIMIYNPKTIIGLYVGSGLIYLHIFLAAISLVLLPVTATNHFRSSRQLLFLSPNSKVQWVFGLGIPENVDSKSISFGLSMKLNYYRLPRNASDIAYPFAEVKEKRFAGNHGEDDEYGAKDMQRGNRWDFYAGLEHFMERLLGEDQLGMECLLRSICEAAARPLFSNSHGGLTAELLQSILTPSLTSLKGTDEDGSYVTSAYLDAEKIGKSGENCFHAFPSCSINLLDLMSTSIAL
ncbi:uncharacterized protein LOC124167178 [Ischnura elegans]|uniref:uncharacterized protein LOC124167178 n=1 Tax=Ischnura elegans TaxID=197161 RepID=UPI001ED88DC5|nr:uncharacterized protein LOC124167178 [Ischnura elegans]